MVPDEAKPMTVMGEEVNSETFIRARQLTHSLKRMGETGFLRKRSPEFSNCFHLCNMFPLSSEHHPGQDRESDQVFQETVVCVEFT